MRRAVNVEVTLKKGEASEKLLRRFSKKCKRNNVVREFLDKTSFFKTKREKRREKTERNKWLRNKHKFRKK